MAHSPLHVCFVADSTNIHVQRWLGGLVKRGLRVTCLSDKMLNEGDLSGGILGADIYPLPNRNSLIALGQKATKSAVLQARSIEIQRLLQKLQPDILHAIFLTQRGWSAAKAHQALTKKFPNHKLAFIITLLGSDIFLPKQHYRSKLHFWRDVWLNRWSLRQADLVTAVNANLMAEAQKLLTSIPLLSLFKAKPQWRLTPIGTDLTHFHPQRDEAALARLRTELSIPERAVVILSPRQITPLYQIEAIIEAFAQLRPQYSNAILLLKDTDCNTPERQAYVAALKTLINRLGISSAVRWASQVSYERLIHYYHLAAMVVSIPKTDGLPVTLFDSMACGVPCIVGDLPAYNDIIIHDVTGLRVPLNGSLSQSLAQQMNRLLTEPKLSEKIVQNSQTILNTYGNFEVTLDQLVKTYEQFT